MIRKARWEDLDFIYQLYMHPLVNPWIAYEPMHPEAFIPIFTDLLKREVKYIFEIDGRPAGMFKLIPLEYRTSHVAYLGGLAIHPDFSGKRLGRQLMQEIIVLGREMGLLRIELSTSVENEKAQKLYLHSGFEKEGILRKYCHLNSEGRYVDEVMMSYLY